MPVGTPLTCAIVLPIQVRHDEFEFASLRPIGDTFPCIQNVSAKQRRERAQSTGWAGDADVKIALPELTAGLEQYAAGEVVVVQIASDTRTCFAVVINKSCEVYAAAQRIRVERKVLLEPVSTMNCTETGAPTSFMRTCART